MGLNLFFHLAFQLTCAVQHILYRSELVQQFQRCFLSNPGNPRNVIGRIAHQTLEINDLQWRQTITLFNLSRIIQLNIGYPFTRQPDMYMFGSKLQHIFVTRYNKHLSARFICAFG
ncbi:hypothetical protein D3C76_1174560 [compost metagenome]